MYRRWCRFSCVVSVMTTTILFFVSQRECLQVTLTMRYLLTYGFKNAANFYEPRKTSTPFHKGSPMFRRWCRFSCEVSSITTTISLLVFGRDCLQITLTMRYLLTYEIKNAAYFTNRVRLQHPFTRGHQCKSGEDLRLTIGLATTDHVGVTNDY